MLKILRRPIAIILVLAMLLSIMNVTVYANDSTSVEPEYTPLYLNESNSTSFAQVGESSWFSFEPQEDGLYYFHTDATWYTGAKLYDSAKNILAHNDGSYEISTTFEIAYNLSAGDTYYLEVYYLDDYYSTDFYVFVELNPIDRIDVEPITLYDGEAEETQEYDYDTESYNTYDKFSWANHLKFVVYLKDGTIVDGSGADFYYNDKWYYLRTNDNQSYDNQWSVGNTYTASIYCEGYETEVSISVDESPFESIEFEPVSLIENADGSLTHDWDSETGQNLPYYEYNWGNYLKFTVNLEGDQKIEASGTGFEYNGVWYYFSYEDPQSYYNQWKVNNTYNVTVGLFGEEYTVPIEIIPSPVENIDIEPITLIENVNGHTSTYYHPDTGEAFDFFRYEWTNHVNATITMKDGPVIETNGYFEYNGKDYMLSCEDTQGYGDVWEAGNTYNVAVTVLGYTTSVQVEIIKTPIESIEFEPITLIENSDGDIEESYDEETDQNMEYFRYYWWRYLNYTITMKDTGEVITSDENGYFEYNGENYEISSSYDTQSHKNQWEAGNIYNVLVKVLGYETTIPVEIVGSPIERIDFEPITLIENSDGGIEESYDEETDQNIEYFRYYWWRYLNYTITMKDTGEVIIPDENGCFEYNGEYYEISSNNDIQSHKNQWEAGNTYNVPVSVLGYETTIPVEIVGTPIENIEFEPITLIENHDGYIQESYDETGEYSEYYRYAWWWGIQYTVTFKDGEVIKSDEDGYIEYNGERYGISTTQDTQSCENTWAPGNTYNVTTTLLGYEATFPVEIISTPIESIVVEPVALLQNYDGYTSIDYDPDTDSYLEYFRYDWWNHLEFTVNFKGGDSLKTNDGFDYNGKWVSLTYNDDQTYYNQWSVGNTYDCSFTILGYTADVAVEIIDSPVESIVVDPIKMIENSGGYMSEDFDPDTEEGTVYYRYSWSNYINGTAKMASGEIIKIENGTYEYDGGYYDVSWEDDQSALNPWRGNETHTGFIIIMGKKVSVSVEITTSPVDRIEIAPLNIVEGTNGSTQSNYDPELDQFDSYYYYSVSSMLNGTIYMKNGDTYKIREGSIVDNNTDYYLSYSENQSSGNPWTVGNTYITTVSFMGASVEVPITITPSPIVSIEAKPITLIFEKGGYTNSEYNPETDDYDLNYYYYDWVNCLSYTITFADGTVISPNSTSFRYNGNTYYLNCFAPEQNYYNEWVPGNVYIASISVMGKSADVSITINNEITTGDFKYIIQNDCAFITDYIGDSAVVTLPEYLDDYPVIGVTSLSDNIEELVIPDSIVSISKEMFYTCNNLRKITIGAGISYLNNGMFEYCHDLEEITVSTDNLYYTAIDNVVYDKSVNKMVAIPRAKTTTHSVPETVTDIEVYFNNTYKFKIELSNSNTGYIVEDGIIYNADKTIVYTCDVDKTGEYVMPDSVEQIAEFAFADNSLSKITISENVSSIVYYAFAGSINLEEVVLPNSLTSIYAGAFTNCPELKTINLPDTIELIGEKAFKNSGVESAVIPAGAEIGYAAFDSSALTELTLREGIKSIDSLAFANTKIKSVVLPDSLLRLGSYAFSNTPLEELTIGTGLTHIPSSAFSGTNLTSVTIPENIVSIGDRAFANSQITNVDIKNHEIAILERAFYNCPIKELELYEGMTTIGEYAFYGIDAREVIFPSSVTNITYHSFENSKNLLNIDIPDNLQSLDGAAFDGTAWYNAQPNGLVYLEHVLYGYKGDMPKNSALTIKDGTKVIADYAFDDEFELKKITIPESVENIGFNAFATCFNLQEIVIDEDNENFYLENDILYDRYGNEVWAKPVALVEGFVGKTYYQYGEEFGFDDSWFQIRLANGEYLWLDYYWSNWFREAPDKYAKGFDPYSPGQQTVTLQIGPFQYSHEVIVEEPYIESVTLDKEKLNLFDGQTGTLSATITPENIPSKFVAWKTSNKKVATVDENGKVTAVGVGTATITATTIYGNCTDSCVVTVTCKHDDIVPKTTKATLSSSGKIEYICSNCGYVESKKTIAAIKSVALSTTSYTYDGKAKTPTVTVKNTSGTALKKDTDYTVTYPSSRTNAGTYSVKITFKGNYSGTKTLTFKINPISSSTCTFKLSATSYTYNGGVKTPTVTVKNASGTTLKKDTDYTVTYASGRKSVGTYSVKVTLKGNYSGTKTLTFKINPISSSTCTFKLSTTSYTYDGKVKTPTVTVKNASGTTLTKDTHYTVTYPSGRKSAGTYSVKVALKGNYSGTKTLTFKINPQSLSKGKFSLSTTAYTYDGKVKAPTVTVKNAAGTKLTKNTHYTVTYASGRKNVGTYKVTIKGKGNYTGTKTLTFKINPAKTSVSKLSGAKKSMTVTVAKKSTQVTGYQIQYATNSKFTSAKTKTITSYKTTKATINSLSAKKTYYVRVRTYKTVSGVKYYSGWSAIKSVKTK